MKARGWWVVMLVMALLVVVPRAMAQVFPETEPASSTERISETWDRSATPSEITIWPRRTLLAYSRDPSRLFGQVHLTCSSVSNPATGACATAGVLVPATGPSEIVLLAREQRSGSTREVRLYGSLRRALSGRACSDDFWTPGARALNAALWEGCASDDPLGTGVELEMPQSELRSLVAGHWQATLVLDVNVQLTGGAVAQKTVEFDFTVTDHDAVSIYFPQYESSSPLVNLDARFDPISQTVGGRVRMEMCLYDGLGSQAAYLGVTARDNGTRTPGPTGFSLWHPVAGTDDSQRLDYIVTLSHNGASVPLANGIEQQLTGIDSSRLELVVLPGMSQPVYCVPTPMTLEIPRVPVASKQSGTYWGDLVIELRVPTATP